MTVDAISSVSMFNALVDVSNTGDVRDVETELNRIYFDMMLKSAFKMASYGGDDTTGIGLYTDLYLQNMAAPFSENHNLGFGQLQLTSDSMEEKK